MEIKRTRFPNGLPLRDGLGLLVSRFRLTLATPQPLIAQAPNNNGIVAP
jgi:hypothetical protein